LDNGCKNLIHFIFLNFSLSLFEKEAKGENSKLKRIISEYELATNRRTSNISLVSSVSGITSPILSLKNYDQDEKIAAINQNRQFVLDLH